MDEERRLVDALADLDALLLPNLWKAQCAKSAAESARARKDGNALYAAPEHNVAAHAEILRLYTRSAAYAPKDSEELALAYGNRSALLAHLRRYREAVEDVDRALDYTALGDILVARYLCRKVECQAELGLEEARGTCEEAKIVLQEIQASDEIKKDMIVKLVKAIVKLEKGEFKAPEPKKKIEIVNSDKLSPDQPSECPDVVSNSLRINHTAKYIRQGRHLLSTRDLPPGEILYVSQPYVACPTESRLHLNCSHCLRFAWAALPCEECAHAVYCSEECRREARRLYHDVECRLIGRMWKEYERMNAGRLMSVRLLVMAIKETGGLEALRRSVEDIDACKDSRKKGFSSNETLFLNNHRGAYSLVSNARKKLDEELRAVSRDSAVLLHLLAKHTALFRRHFDSDRRALARSEDALFVGRLLSHYQHVVIVNAVTVKDAYTESSTDWTWTAPKEENCTGLYLTPFLSLINHSCNPNVAKCEMEDRRTILYSIQPIAKGEQIFDCYGPSYAEMLKKARQDLLLQRFYFTCNCIACENNWPIFMHMISNGVTFSTISLDEVDATTRAVENSDMILEAMRDGNFKCDLDAVRDLAYAILLTIKYCKSPNWRLPSLIATLTAIFNDVYGYVVDIPTKC